MYIKPGDLSGPNVFMNPTNKKMQSTGATDSIPTNKKMQSTGAQDEEPFGGKEEEAPRGLEEEQRGSPIEYNRRITSMDSSSSVMEQSSPTPYPTSSKIQHSEFEMALGTGLSNQYGTNAGSIQKHYGKTPGSVYGDSKVPIRPMKKTDNTSVDFMDLPSYNRFTSPLHEYHNAPKKVFVEDTYVGSG
jgi:hypothetical protein